jgi:hypothetical protein
VALLTNVIFFSIYPLFAFFLLSLLDYCLTSAINAFKHFLNLKKKKFHQSFSTKNYLFKCLMNDDVISISVVRESLDATMGEKILGMKIKCNRQQHRYNNELVFSFLFIRFLLYFLFLF